ncbi:MAG: alpha/beta hydrolase, partial [Oscillospiraceae bacterium]
LGAILLILLALFAVSYMIFKKMLVRTSGDASKDNDQNSESKWRALDDEAAAAEKWLRELPCEQVSIKSFDSLTLKGLYIPAAMPSENTVIAIHGYKSTGVHAYASYVRFYREIMGYNILLPDNRAHGESEGKYIGFGCLDRLDCIGWCKFIVERNKNICNILLHGISMGAATVMAASGEKKLPAQVMGIVADCGYTSAYEEISSIIKTKLKLPAFLLVPIISLICRLFAGYSFKDAVPVEQVKSAKVPILFIHGDADSVVPVWMAYKLFEACKSQRKLYIVKGAKHISCYRDDRQKYEKNVSRFAANVGMAQTENK